MPSIRRTCLQRSFRILRPWRLVVRRGLRGYDLLGELHRYTDVPNKLARNNNSVRKALGEG